MATRTRTKNPSFLRKAKAWSFSWSVLGPAWTKETSDPSVRFPSLVIVGDRVNHSPSGPISLHIGTLTNTIVLTLRDLHGTFRQGQCSHDSRLDAGDSEDDSFPEEQGRHFTMIPPCYKRLYRTSHNKWGLYSTQGNMKF